MPIPFSIPVDSMGVLDHWETEIDRHPRHADTRLAYAAALNNADDPAGAVEQSSQALAQAPKMREAARLLASLLRRYEINPDIDVSPKGLEAAFAFDDVDRQALSVAAIGYLKSRSPLDNILATGITDGWETAARTLFTKTGAPLLKEKLFRAALTCGFNMDASVEELLTASRRHLLLRLSRDRLRDRALYDFVCALILQCANNEYVFYAADDELQTLHLLTENFQRNLESSRVSDDLLLLSLYKPASVLVTKTGQRAQVAKSVPRALRNVLQTIWRDQEDEDARAKSVMRLTEVADETSKRVADQYADDPYPRWLSMQTPDPGSARQTLTAHFASSDLAFLDSPSKVLIAGCGTGQQAVHSALFYGSKADVLAIDVTARSLGYAARMAERYDVSNLHFAQADILGLAGMDDSFDLIESVGVLHHMAAPYDAWRILVDRLRPGGLMLIGLYSAVSRLGLSALRADPSWPGIDADDDALRAFRRSIMRRPQGAPGTDLLLSRDFFVKSGFRDLALHVSEQQCTLPEIKTFLNDNQLVFHGFHLPLDILQQYSERFPDDGLPGTLDNWQLFEQENPRTFDGMYNFWCRKT